MPRVPTLTARGGVAPLRLKRPTARDIGGGAFEALTGFGEQLGVVAAKLQRSQDQLDLSELEGEYNAGIKAARIKAEQDPDYQNQPKLFKKDAEALKADVLSRAKTRIVATALGSHINRTLPVIQTEVEAKAIELGQASQLAQLDRLEEDLSDRIASSGDPSEVAELKLRHKTHLNSMQALGLFKPGEAEKRERGLATKSAEKQMDVLRRTGNRARLFELDRAGAFAKADPTKRLKILEAARKDQEREETKEEQLHENVVEIVEQRWSALANFGELRQADLEEAKAGRHRYITPDKARALEKINEDPPSGAGALQIGAIMQDYGSGEPTVARARIARALLNKLAAQGIDGKSLRKAFFKLQSDQVRLEGIEASRVNKEISKGVRELKLGAPERLVKSKILTQKRKNQLKQDELELRKRIEGGETRREVLEDFAKRDKAAKDIKPAGKKKVDTLLGR